MNEAIYPAYQMHAWERNEFYAIFSAHSNRKNKTENINQGKVNIVCSTITPFPV